MSTAEFYRDGAGDWRWRVKAANHEIVADSAEGYRHLQDAKDEFNRLFGPDREDIDIEYLDGEA